MNLRSAPKPAEGADAPTLVGALLRERRRQLKLTLASVAQSVGITKGFLSQIERDKASPSVPTLMRLRSALSLSIASLFKSSLAHTVRATERQLMPYGGDGLHSYLISARDAHRVTVIWATWEPGARSGAEPHAVDADEEVILVISGSLEIIIDGEASLLRAGDSFTFDPRSPHQFRNPSSRLGAVSMCLVAPPPRDDGL
jgi:transcriptional regulator with XRE-family HTH domain